MFSNLLKGYISSHHKIQSAAFVWGVLHFGAQESPIMGPAHCRHRFVVIQERKIAGFWALPFESQPRSSSRKVIIRVPFSNRPEQGQTAHARRLTLTT